MGIPALLAQASHRQDGPRWRWRLWQRQAGQWWEALDWPEYEFPEIEGPQIDWSRWAFLLDWARAVFWLALAVLAAVALWQIIEALLPYWQGRFERWQQQRQVPDMEILAVFSVDDWLVRSRDRQAAGDFAGACRCLYFAMLQLLHERGVLTHKRSRTDGEYLQAIRQKFSQPQPYQTLLLVHQQLTFGDGAEIGDETLVRCRDAWQIIGGDGARRGTPS